MLNPRPTILIIACLLLASMPTIQAANLSVGGSGGGSCDHYYHQSINQLAGVITGGDVEVWGGTEACSVVRSPTQSVVWVGRMSGPSPLGTATPNVAWSTLTATGCTVSSFTTTSDNFLGIAVGSSTYATITMTSNECRAVIQMDYQVALVGGTTGYRVRVALPISLVHEDHAYYNFLCAATGTTASAQDPDSATCNTPDSTSTISGSLGIDVLDDTTNDAMLTVPPTTISNISVNGTFPSEIDVNAHFPGDSENLGIDAWTTALFWIAAVLFFSYMGWLVALAFAVPGLLAAMVPSVKTMLDGLGLDFEALFMLCLLGFILELAANRFQWGGYSSGARRLRLVGA